MRPITTDIKALVGKLGPVAMQALQLAVGTTASAGGAEITPDHLVRAMLDLPDCDLCAAMNAANLARPDVAARLDWHLKRLPGGQKGKPAFAPALHLLLQDAAALTSDRVRTGHLAAALLADPSLSAAGVASLLGALPREARFLMASRQEDQGEVGRAAATAAPAKPAAAPAPVQTTYTRTATTPQAPAPEPVAAAASTPRAAPTNAAALKARFADRVVAADAGGITIKARVGASDTTMRLAWDMDARVLVIRIALPADPPQDEVSAAIALSTLNNALPHGAFVLDEGRLAFRSHVFLDADGNAPVETVAFAARVCEQAAEALGDAEG